MNAQIRDMVKDQILYTLNQLPNPAERLELLKELIPGAVETKVRFETLKDRIAAKLEKKARYKIPEKPTRTKKKINL